MKNKSLFLVIFAIILGIFIWQRKSPKKIEGTEKIKITILGENSSTIQAMMSLEKEYETQNPNIDLVFLPNTFDDAFNKSNQDFANKTGLYDIVMQYNFSLSSLVGNNYVYPMDELVSKIPNIDKAFENDLLPKSWEEVGFYFKNEKKHEEGKVKIGYPFASNSMLLMYNKEMFENEKYKQAYKLKYNKELVLPKTWEDFYTIAQFFTDKEKNTYGVCLEGATGGFLYYEWSNLLYGMGGKIMDKNVGWHGNENSKILLNSPESIKALTFYKSLKPFNNGNFSNVEQAAQMQIMKEGKTALAIVWSDMIYPTIKTETGIDQRFGFTVIPGGKSVLAGGAYFINRQSKNPEQATKYVMNLMQSNNQIALTRKGLSSASKKAYEDNEVKQLPYANALFESLNRGGVVLEAGPDATIISEIITTYVQKYWNNELSVEQSIQKAQSEIETKRKAIFANLGKK